MQRQKRDGKIGPQERKKPKEEKKKTGEETVKLILNKIQRGRRELLHVPAPTNKLMKETTMNIGCD